PSCMLSCLQILEAFLCFGLSTLLNVPSIPTRRSSDLAKRLGTGVPGQWVHLEMRSFIMVGQELAQEGLIDVAVLLLQKQRGPPRSEEHTSELQSRFDLVCRLLLEKNMVRSYYPS